MSVVNWKDFPQVELGFFPTPIHPLPVISQSLPGVSLWVKRDDQTGLAFGGNKTRKLQFLVGRAIEEECDCLVTAGALQSNHCRQTAAAGAKARLPVHLVLGGTPPDSRPGNLLLDELLGATLHFAGEKRKGETIPALIESLKNEGLNPCHIPYGGSNPVGAAGFALAFFELLEQCQKIGLVVDNLVFPSSSGGTHAGLMVGKALSGSPIRLVGIAVDKEDFKGEGLEVKIADLAGQTAEWLGHPHPFSPKEVFLEKSALGAGYGVMNGDDKRAIHTFAKGEGLFLDPVYTGRAAAGLFKMVERGDISEGSTVLFWHTGGTPSLFHYGEDLLSEEIQP